MIDDLLALAETLSSGIDRNQAELRRAVSTAYYALFHAIARDAADRFAGPEDRDGDAWVRVYRALDHGSAIRACQQVKDQGFGPEITRFARSFVELQEARHTADYDPLLELDVREAALLVRTARVAIEEFRQGSQHQRQRLAIYLLFKKR